MRSMTGCGTGRVQQDGWEVTVELKTVNHRFLDVSMRLPRNLSFLEQPIRSRIGKGLKRGHVDVYVTVRNQENASAHVTVDPALARLYAEAARQIAEISGAANDVTVSALMRLEGVTVLTEPEMDEETVTCLCMEACGLALDRVTAMREKEGEQLKQDLALHLGAVEALREEVLGRAPMVVTDYREKLETRLKALRADGVDPQRLAQETALMADRCAIDEELARLESHLGQMWQYLEAEGEIGKKMDFLIQEMNRETNTIGSKASDLFIAQRVVSMKSEIEKMREQIQNAE